MRDALTKLIYVAGHIPPDSNNTDPTNVPGRGAKKLVVVRMAFGRRTTYRLFVLVMELWGLMRTIRRLSEDKIKKGVEKLTENANIHFNFKSRFWNYSQLFAT